MSYGDNLFLLPNELKNDFRKYEDIRKKIINTKWSLVFNQTCLKENLWPIYTNFRNHDPALTEDLNTLQYKKYLIEREIQMKKAQLRELLEEEEAFTRKINQFQVDQNLLSETQRLLSIELTNHNNVTKAKILKKLNNLYGGKIFIKNDHQSFINLSSYVINQDEEDFLNLGLNCHLQPRYDKLQKQTEIEVLYQNILDLESKKKVMIHSNLADRLRAEGVKHRNTKYKSVLTPNLKQAAKQLQANNDIVIRRADKSATYVILNKSDYFDKVNTLLCDSSKFVSIIKDPSNDIKSKANKLIDALNATSNNCNISRIVGDYQPGYMYGNVKIHKPHNPLRPIISQVTTSTYNLAKTINKILTPYIPSKYMLKSTNDLIDILQTTHCEGITASLDVESLFTNVPIDPTIEIILELAYNHPNLPPPQIPKTLLKQFLALCTKELPFRAPDGKLYRQVEGVAMGSPLGPLFANFYMSYLENSVLSNTDNKPTIYARYVDDIFLQIQSIEELQNLKAKFENNSVLKFTFELNENNKLPFLDTLIDTSDNTFHTKVYHKPTDSGHCLNAESECCEKYKNSVISNYLNRAYKISQNWQDFHTEINHMKQVLINNNYSNSTIDRKIEQFINNKLTSNNNNNPATPKTKIKLYYHSQFHPNYKIDERIMKEIVNDNVKCTDQQTEIDLIIYYKNKKTHNLIMKNNSAPAPPISQRTNVVYKFNCPYPHGEAENYIGLTTTTINTRMTRHVQTGSIRKHFEDVHHTRPTKSEILDNTSILTFAENRQKLYIKEALFILQENPTINRQYDNFTNILKLYKSRNHASNSHTQHNHISPVSTQVNSPISTSQTPTLSHQASPQITLRINQLMSNSRNIHNNNQQTHTQYSPISNRLRSFRNNIHSN